MPIKSVKMKISKNKKLRFFLISQELINPKISFLGQKVWPVARAWTDRQTDSVTTEGTLSGFQDVFLRPIIKNRPNIQSQIWHATLVNDHNTALVTKFDIFLSLLDCINAIIHTLSQIYHNTYINMQDHDLMAPLRLPRNLRVAIFRPYLNKWH